MEKHSQTQTLTMARKKAEPSTIPAEEQNTTPVADELKSLTEEPTPAPSAPSKEEIETDVRKKLTTKTDEENIFVPTSPAVLEAAAKKVAETEGFELNRGTSIGARLLARSRKMV